MNKQDLQTFREQLKDAHGVDEIWEIVSKTEEPLRSGIVETEDEASWASEVISLFLRADDGKNDSERQALLWAGKVSLTNREAFNHPAGYEIQNARENLGKWLRRTDWPKRYRFTEDLLDLAAQALNNESSWRQACWLISSIGWRTEKIENLLKAVASENDNLRGDFAFCTLMDLGIAPLARREYVDDAHRRFIARPGRQTLFAIKCIGSPTSLQLLSQDRTWGTVEDESYGWMLIPPTIAGIADRANDETVAVMAIGLLKEMFARNQVKMRSAVYLGGNVISSCDTSEAVAFLLDLLFRGNGGDAKALHAQSLLLLRMEQCIRPFQLRGFVAPDKDALIQITLKNALGVSNEYRGRNATFEGEAKNRFWNLTLMLGNAETVKLGLQFLDADKSPYAQFKVLDDLSCLSISELTPQIKYWVTAEESLDQTEMQAEVLPRMAAIRFVWSSATIEAFNLLLGSRYLSSGHTLADLADGLSYLAVKLAKIPENRRQIIRALFECLEAGPQPPQSGCVCQAIEALGFAGYLDEADYKVLSRFIVEGSGWIKRDEKGPLASAFAKAPPEILTPALLDIFSEWAVDPDFLISSSAFETLINLNRFPDLPPINYSRLGLARHDGRWSLRLDEQPNVSGGLLSLLVSRYPNEFTEVFSSMISQASFKTFLEAMETLKRLNKGNENDFTGIWSDDLVRRAKDRNSRHFAEPYVFDCLRVHSPAALASEKWSQVFDNWPGESREALAVSLGKLTTAVLNEAEHWKDTFFALQQDAYFGVRRATFRSMGRVHLTALEDFVSSAVESQTPSVKQLACEAIYWIPEAARDNWWHDAIESLRNDAAEDVRDAFTSALERNRKLVWAEQYLSILTSPFTNGNQDVLSRWKYAKALTQVGDDETSDKLRRFLHESDLAAHVQRFIIQTTENLEKNWEKCRKKWPEPLFPSGATLRTGNGVVRIKDREFPVKYAIWESADVQKPLQLLWSGTAVSQERLPESAFDQYLEFTEEDGRKLRILIHNWQPPFRFSFVADVGEPVS